MFLENTFSLVGIAFFVSPPKRLNWQKDNLHMKRMILCKTYADTLKKAGEVATEFGRDPDKKLYVFCEDKLTMSLESEIARANGGGTFNTDVVTFSRFIRKNYKGGELRVLDKQSSAMAVKNILLKNVENLSCFKKCAFDPNTASSIFELIAQLKSATVSHEKLLESSGKTEGVLKSKLSDIAFVYGEYEKYLAEKNVYDSNSYLAILDDILKNGSFNGASAIIVAFGSLTRQGLEIVKTLDKTMENLTAILLSGENEDLYTNEVKTLLMREIGGFSVEESTTPLSKEREVLINRLFNPEALSLPPLETKNVHAYEAANAEEEIKHIAKNIRREVIGGRRYKDIAVAVGEPSGYFGAIERVFGAYEIPFFTDKPEVLSTHPLSKLVLSYFDALRTDYAVENVISLVKNPYFFDKKTADLFENFVLRNAVTRRGIKNGLKLAPDNPERFSDGYAAFEEARRIIFSLPGKGNYANELSDATEELFRILSAEEKNTNYADKLRNAGFFSKAAFTAQAFEKTRKLIFDIKEILSDSKIGVTDYRNVLASGFGATEISVIPQLYDCVYVGDYKDCKYSEHAILFAAGMSGDVPFAKSDTAILTDKDLVKLEKYDCLVEPKIKIVNKRERENVGAALISFGEKLYVSRAAYSSDGKPLSKGRTFDSIIKMFSDGGNELEVFSERKIAAECERNKQMKAAYDVLNYNAISPATEEFLTGSVLLGEKIKTDFEAESAFLDALKSVSPEKADYAEKLLGKTKLGVAKPLKENADLIFRKNRISASVLECYFGCPFACFMQNGLRVKERLDENVQANEYGTFIHSALEKYVSFLKDDLERLDKRITDKASSDEVVKEIISELKKDYAYSHYLDEDKYKAIFALIEKETCRVAWDQYLSFTNSSFRPVATEARFGPKGKFPSIKLKTRYGEKNVTGYIDRIDRSGDMVRIIDYKTGKTHEKDEEFYTGNNIQLYLYMNAVLQENDRASGAYYYPVSDKFAVDDEFIYALKGKTLGEEDVIRATDFSVSEGEKCKILDSTVIFTGDNKATSKSKSIISSEDFSRYVRYAKAVSEKGAEEISEGVIAPSPYADKCRYCKFSAICGTDERSVKERKENNVNAETIIEATENDNGN